MPSRSVREGRWTRSGSWSAPAPTAARSFSSAAGAIAAIATARGAVPSGRGAPPSTPPAGAISTAGAAASATRPPSPVSGAARKRDASDFPGLGRLRHRRSATRHAVSACDRSPENAEIGSPPTTSENVPRPMGPSGNSRRRGMAGASPSCATISGPSAGCDRAGRRSASRRSPGVSSRAIGPPTGRSSPGARPSCTLS